MIVSSRKAVTLATPLRAFLSEVEIVRKAFLTELAQLPEPLNTVATRQFLDRINRAKGRAVLGEYAPWLIADLAGIADRRAIRELAIPWLSIYTYIVFLDDMIDQQELADRELLLIASGLLLERALTKLHNLSADTKALLAKVDEYFTQTAIAAVSELKKHRLTIQSFSDEEIAVLGHKVASLKLCTFYILSARGVKTIGEVDLKAIDALGTGIQLLDDITDWEEDWRVGNYTYPLSLTIGALYTQGIERALNPQEFTPDEVLTGMVLTGALERSIDRSIGFLKIALKKGKPIDNSPAADLLNVLVQNALWLKNRVAEARGIFEAEKSSCRDTDWLRQIVEERRIQEEIHGLRRFIAVAQDLPC